MDGLKNDKALFGAPSLELSSQAIPTVIVIAHCYSSDATHVRQIALVEQLRYNMLYRWFVGLSLDDAVWDATTFTKNRQRFADGEVTGKLLEAVVEQARQRRLLSERHFCVDGTLIEAWASMGSYRRKDDDSDPPS